MSTGRGLRSGTLNPPRKTEMGTSLAQTPLRVSSRPSNSQKTKAGTGKDGRHHSGLKAAEVVAKGRNEGDPITQELKKLDLEALPQEKNKILKEDSEKQPQLSALGPEKPKKLPEYLDKPGNRPGLRSYSRHGIEGTSLDKTGSHRSPKKSLAAADAAAAGGKAWFERLSTPRKAVENSKTSKSTKGHEPISNPTPKRIPAKKNATPASSNSKFGATAPGRTTRSAAALD